MSKNKPKYNPYLASGMIDIDSPYFINHWQELEGEWEQELPAFQLTEYSPKSPKDVTIQIFFHSRKDRIK